MRTKKQRFGFKDSEIPLSAMIDVVFLLLVYFIVAQKPIVENTLLSADVPSGDIPAHPVPPKPLLKIGVCDVPGKAEDYYRLNGTAVKLEDLRNYTVLG